MKTKNVKVRLADVKQGVTVYVAHPVYGIGRQMIQGKPYLNKHTKSLFVKVRYAGYSFESRNSLCDMGITSTYNDRRTFFKLKHAEAWVEKWKNDIGFQQRQAEHEEHCAMLGAYEDYTDIED